jgi:hypothetical protein
MSAFQTITRTWEPFSVVARKDLPERFTKLPFENAEKVATICGKSSKSSQSKTMVTACKHPRVRIVSRHEDTEYVECLECGDVFDSDEFHDMAIEEESEKEEETERE